MKFSGRPCREPWDSEDVEEESDALTAEVLEALGIETSAQLASAPQTRLPGKQAVDASEPFSSADEEDLEEAGCPQELARRSIQINCTLLYGLP